jgi:poly(hydroxyalkanoate) granule-associated protein
MATKSENSATAELRESAHRIWLAGLGALATAETRGEQLFHDLVERGEDFAKRTRPAFDSMRSGVRKARKTAEGTWDQVERTIDETVSRALKRIGVPTRSEIGALTRRVEELTTKLEHDGKKKTVTRAKKKTPSRKAGAAKRKTAKTAPRKTARKRTSRTS